MPIKSFEEIVSIVRDKYAVDPGFMPSALAAELDVPEAVVIRALPEDTRVEAPATEFASIWAEMTGWDKVTVVAANTGFIFEYAGKLPQGKPGHGMFNLMDKDTPLGGHLMIEKLGTIWFVSKPFFRMDSLSVRFYTVAGEPMLGVYVGRDAKHKLLVPVVEAFAALRSRYVNTEAAA